MRNFFFHLPLIVCLLASPAGAWNPPDEAIRKAVERHFTLLRTRQYQPLYNSLPASVRQKTTREEMAESLERLRRFLKIDRMEIGEIEQRGPLAVATTTIYGRLVTPLNLNGQEISEGRVTTQQYLINEDGRWKIASATEGALRDFLRTHPEAATQFRQSHTRFELRGQQGWVRMPGSR